MEITVPLGGRMETVEDYEDDIATCDFLIESGDKLYCIVDAAHPTRILYEDGLIVSDRKIVFAPMFSGPEYAQKFVDSFAGSMPNTETGRDVLFILNPQVFGVSVVNLVEAAKARAARNVEAIRWMKAGEHV